MICAIVLAAGESRRMGSQKLLLPFAKTTVIGHVVGELLRSELDGIYVVVGHEANRISEELSGRCVTIVANPDYKLGMLSSVRCGLQALPEPCDKVLAVLGDQPAVTSELVNQLVRSSSTTDKGILVPVYRGKRGHPILFSTRYRDEIMTSFDDSGLRGLLQSHPDDIFELTVSTPAALSDIDSPDDYRRALASFDGIDQAPGTG
ncbi:MAG: nucleotidyltransferase family protein [bacterium]|nr:nucleotidyltransferase family protein [bacterium]